MQHSRINILGQTIGLNDLNFINVLDLIIQCYTLLHSKYKHVKTIEFHMYFPVKFIYSKMKK